MDTLTALTQYYNLHNEDQRLQSRHGSVEFLTTMRYIEKYLRPGMRILEIGAGTGRYSHHLARMGYEVDAVELIEHNIHLFNSFTQPGEKITIRQGNALDLSAYQTESYDLTLLLGPMYHLYTREEQHKALAESIRVTKNNGIVFAAYCNNDATILQFCFGKRGILHPHYASLIDPVTFKTFSTPEELFQLYRKEDIDSLMEAFQVTRLHYVGTDMATNFMKEVIDNMDDALFEQYLRYHFSICERTDMVGATHHMLDVFRKEKLDA